MLARDIFAWVYLAVVAATVAAIIEDNGGSGRKFSWLLVVILFPIGGFVLYLFFGINQRHHRVFVKRHKRFTDKMENELDGRTRAEFASESALEDIRPKYHPLARLLAQGILLPKSRTQAEIIVRGKRKYELLMEDLKNARESIHMEYFHFGMDRGSKAVRDMLMQKAREGVKVRFINENFANLPIPPRYYNQMKKAGVEVVSFTNPKRHLIELATYLNYRNHRKIVVIDNRIAYTGGMNINDHYFLQWRDTHLRLTGDIVASLQLVFLDSWVTSGGELDRPLPDYLHAGPHQDPLPGADIPLLRDKVAQLAADEPDSPIPVLRLSYEWALYNARDYFYLQTPYFTPPQSLLDALKAAAASGIDVRVMLPAKVDTLIMRPANRAYYKECLEAGIRIYERQGEFIHSKTFVSDDYLSMVGTTNVDERSFSIDYEDNVYFYDEECALRAKEIFFRDLEQCREITLAEVNAWPWPKRFFQKIVRLFDPQL